MPLIFCFPLWVLRKMSEHLQALQNHGISILFPFLY